MLTDYILTEAGDHIILEDGSGWLELETAGLPNRMTQEVVEVWQGGPGLARQTAIAVEVFAFVPQPVRKTQHVVEVWQGGPAVGRMTQAIVELWVVLPPCTEGEMAVDDVTPGGSCPSGILE